MCLILDANNFSEFARNAPTMEPARNWVEKNGKIAYSPTREFEKELFDGPNNFLELFKTYSRSNKIKQCDKKDVLRMQNKLSNLRSDDPHIIALAKVSKAKLLISCDIKLHEDFKNHTDGSIYQDASHKHLLRGLSCP